MGFFDRLFRPRQDKFLALLLEQAQSTLAGLELLEEFMRSDSNKNAKAVGKAEKAADEVRRILIDEFNRTYITPIDREDIYALSRAIDDVMDYAYTTVDEMDILKVDPNPYLQKMASLLTGSWQRTPHGSSAIKGPPQYRQRSCQSSQNAGEPGRIGLSRSHRRSIQGTCQQ